MREGRIQVVYGDQSIANWRRREGSGHELDAPLLGGRVRLYGEYGFSILDFDERGVLVQKLTCIRVDTCRLEFASPPLLFKAYLPRTDPKEVAEVRARLDTLWSSFQLED